MGRQSSPGEARGSREDQRSLAGGSTPPCVLEALGHGEAGIEAGKNNLLSMLPTGAARTSERLDQPEHMVTGAGAQGSEEDTLRSPKAKATV